MLVNHIHELIGNTPIVKLNTLTQGLHRDVYLKLEWFNPGGSVKDRIALSMIEAAEKDRLISPGDTIIEPTSGNTGIGLALVCASKKYNLIIVMPDSVSLERRKILTGLGAKLILSSGDKGMKGAIEIAQNLANKHGYFMPMQFENLNNPLTHMKHTAEEIKRDLKTLDALVIGVGTGGTITGTGKILKSHYPNLSIVAVEPKDSSVLSGNPPGSHKIQGIGAGFIPPILDASLYQEIIQVSNDDAFKTARSLAIKEGIFGGISTGANVFAAIEFAKKLPTQSSVLTVSPSNAERYLSTDLFNE